MSKPSLDTPGCSARRELAFDEADGGFSLTLKRNCSLSPAGLGGAFLALAGVVLAIGIGFALAGAWLVLPFAGLEVLLLGAAFVLQARHAADYERIQLAGAQLRVEVGEAARRACYQLDARGVRLDVRGDNVVLRGPREEVEIGRHLDAATRIAFAAELKRRLRI